MVTPFKMGKPNPDGTWPSGKRIWAGKAYLQELEPGIYQLFRDMLEGQRDERTGELIKEKMGRAVPWSPFLREAAPGERVVLRTVHPVTQMELHLTEIDSPEKTE